MGELACSLGRWDYDKDLLHGEAKKKFILSEKKKKRICRNIRLGNQDSMQTQNWLDHFGRSTLQKRIQPPQSPFLLLMKCPVYMEHRKDSVLTPRNIQSKALSQKALSGCRNFSLSVSLFLYLSVFLLVETPSFYLALWDTKKSFIMECRFPIIPRVSSSLSRSPVKSASRDWCPRVCMGILLWFALYISMLFYLYT